MAPLHTQAAHMTRLLDGLVAAANSKVHQLFAYTGGDPDQIEQMYPAAIQPALSASSTIGAQWYHQQAPDSGFAVRTVPPPPADQLQANVRWAFAQPSEPKPTTVDNPFAGLSAEPKPRSPFEALSQSTERHVYNANRDTIITNADREHVMYARQAGPDACAFCRLLATRSTLYSSKGVQVDPDTGKEHMVVIGAHGRTRGTRKIGEDYHDNCKCVAVPVRPGETYKPPDYVDPWREQYTNAVKDPDTHGLKDIVNHMRRQQYHADKLAGALSQAGLSN